MDLPYQLADQPFIVTRIELTLLFVAENEFAILIQNKDMVDGGLHQRPEMGIVGQQIRLVVKLVAKRSFTLRASPLFLVLLHCGLVREGLESAQLPFGLGGLGMQTPDVMLGFGNDSILLGNFIAQQMVVQMSGVHETPVLIFPWIRQSH
jgi:hypothetical protein